MAINDYKQFPHNQYGPTAPMEIYQQPTIEDLKKQAEIRQIEMETAMRQAEMEMMLQKAAVGHVPFDETEEFRDFIVWLCGFTDRDEPASKKDWDSLRERVGKIAAKFALKAKDRARDDLLKRAQADRYKTQSSTGTTSDTQAVFRNSTATLTSTGLEPDKPYTLEELTS